MQFSKLKKPLTLGVLFLLPVSFLLVLYPSTHFYNPLDIVNENVLELDHFDYNNDEAIQLKDHITVLGFLGSQPDQQGIAALNLKELIYDKFKGFKRFQVVIVVNDGTEEEVKQLKKELHNYEPLEYWHFVSANSQVISKLFESLKSEQALDETMATNHVFIIDKELHQRGRIDDREKREIEANKPSVTLTSYDCVEVAEIKNKMSEDLRILFTEYRQKRKGDFNSTVRRAEDLSSK